MFTSDLLRPTLLYDYGEVDECPEQEHKPRKYDLYEPQSFQYQIGNIINVDLLIIIIINTYVFPLFIILRYA